ncbi:unnamed protein product [Dovyalis caffra]|uniref:Secreted protein n=1 Tax=Dovyalis caffra TaxID=77055 RepID=A0AAV1R1V5_9ROSI|nr:unnamed protein product [Dovyalis caffra]
MRLCRGARAVLYVIVMAYNGMMLGGAFAWRLKGYGVYVGARGGLWRARECEYVLSARAFVRMSACEEVGLLWEELEHEGPGEESWVR